ncbi:HNH endonuclease signature motif containing protein [Amycolatopsis minnesotensis]|uniref:HNH endonuclease signature motif containing protein n=1 Tax=Amycolatopsis minnesotensis TaxID=337894 RepID=UPI0031D7E170
MSETSSLVSQRELWQCSAREAAALLQEKFVALWRLESQLCRIIAHLDNGGARELGYTGVTGLVADIARSSGPGVTKLVTRALVTNPSHSVGGVEIPAAAPVAGEAVREGEISPEHVDGIVRVLEKIPATVSVEDREFAERSLVELARHAGIGEIGTLGKEILGRLDPDGTEPRDTPEPKRALNIHQRKDGSAKFDGYLDPISAAKTLALLDPLAQTQPDDPSDNPLLRGRAERYGDAFMEMVNLAASHPESPNRSGGRADLIVTIPLADLKRELGAACLDMVTDITASEARILACDCKVIPAILDGAGQPLEMGRARRLVTEAMRLMLAIRDRGCCFPGCSRRPRHCEAHHVLPWYAGGATDLGNLTLLCSRHHRLLHTSDWTLRMVNGQPEFTPPAFVDPWRRPRTNRPTAQPRAA